METSVNITQSTYSSLKSECEAAGISLSQLCREADVDRSVVERWKEKDPKSIQTLNTLREALERIKSHVNTKPNE
jgi:transcriptional regulator with XRE-family HTH domain